MYEQSLVHDTRDVKVMLQGAYHGRPLNVGTTTILEPGAPVVWFVFPGCWYDIARFHRADGTFTGWYTNFCTPVRMSDDRWSSTDLFLDLWVDPHGSHTWLDELEYAAASADHLIDRATIDRVTRDRTAIQRRVDAGQWPPGVTREIELSTVLTFRAQP